jgi:hypothetical protein
VSPIYGVTFDTYLPDFPNARFALGTGMNDRTKLLLRFAAALKSSVLRSVRPEAHDMAAFEESTKSHILGVHHNAFVCDGLLAVLLDAPLPAPASLHRTTSFHDQTSGPS